MFKNPKKISSDWGNYQEALKNNYPFFFTLSMLKKVVLMLTSAFVLSGILGAMLHSWKFITGWPPLKIILSKRPLTN